MCVEDKVTGFIMQAMYVWRIRLRFHNAGYVCVEDKVMSFIRQSMYVWRIRLRVS